MATDEVTKKTPFTERPEGMGMIVTEQVAEGWMNVSVDLSHGLIGNPEALEFVLAEIGSTLKRHLKFEHLKVKRVLN